MKASNEAKTDVTEAQKIIFDLQDKIDKYELQLKEVDISKKSEGQVKIV